MLLFEFLYFDNFIYFSLSILYIFCSILYMERAIINSPTKRKSYPQLEDDLKTQLKQPSILYSNYKLIILCLNYPWHDHRNNHDKQYNRKAFCLWEWGGDISLHQLDLGGQSCRKVLQKVDRCKGKHKFSDGEEMQGARRDNLRRGE